MVSIVSKEIIEQGNTLNRVRASFKYTFDDGKVVTLRSMYFPAGTDLDVELDNREAGVLAGYIQFLKDEAASVPRQRIENKFDELLQLADEGTDVTNPQMDTLRTRLLQLAQHRRDNP